MSNGARELDGQVALVTGSAKNIGRAINLALSDAGAKVVINALSSGARAGRKRSPPWHGHCAAPPGATSPVRQSA